MTPQPHDDVTVLPHLSPARAERVDLRVDVRIPGVEGSLEQLAVRRTTETGYEVCCLPFALYGIGLGDVVEITGLGPSSPGEVGRVVTAGGRFLHRLVLRRPDAGVLAELASSLVVAGHLVEVWDPVLLAVDAADAGADASLRAFLAAGVRDGRWQWEVASPSAV